LLAYNLESAYGEAEKERKDNDQLVGKLMLGVSGNRERFDLSDYLVHFTKDPEPYWNMLKILGGQELVAGPLAFGCSRNVQNLDQAINRAICFSETPLGYLKKFAKNRSEYGIGFSKNFILENGGMPIWYVPTGSTVSKAIHQLMKLGKERDPDDRKKKTINYDNPIWNLCSFVEETRDFGRMQHQFQWEREWRIAGAELKFKPNDVAFLIIPERLHVNARQFFRNAALENTGPAYLECPFIDGNWGLSKYAQERSNKKTTKIVNEVVSSLLSEAVPKAKKKK